MLISPDAIRPTFVQRLWQQNKNKKGQRKKAHTHETAFSFVVSDGTVSAMMCAHHLMLRIFLIINIISCGCFLSSVANRSCTLFEIASTVIIMCGYIQFNGMSGRPHIASTHYISCARQLC